MALHRRWSSPFIVGAATLCSVPLSFVGRTRSTSPRIASGPLHTIQLGARIAATVRAAGQ